VDSQSSCPIVESVWRLIVMRHRRIQLGDPFPNESLVCLRHTAPARHPKLGRPACAGVRLLRTLSGVNTANHTGVRRRHMYRTRSRSRNSPFVPRDYWSARDRPPGCSITPSGSQYNSACRISESVEPRDRPFEEICQALLRQSVLQPAVSVTLTRLDINVSRAPHIRGIHESYHVVPRLHLPARQERPDLPCPAASGTLDALVCWGNRPFLPLAAVRVGGGAPGSRM
jgi:hypothetical protein